jgi:putative transposase
MPRQARRKSETGIYHIMVRGVNRQQIFIDDEDCLKFIWKLEQVKVRSDFKLYGYCLMGNHAHLLLCQREEPLSRIMQSLCSSYVHWYNWKYDRIGHLFQERFKSEVVETDSYLITVLRYIHQNPVKAGITDSVANYRWSSYCEYYDKPKITDTEFVLKMYSKDKQRAVSAFVEHTSESNNDKCLEYAETRRYSDEALLNYIMENYGAGKSSFQSLQESDLGMIIGGLKEIDGVTIRQIVRVTGISKYKVEKA